MSSPPPLAFDQASGPEMAYLLMDPLLRILLHSVARIPSVEDQTRLLALVLCAAFWPLICLFVHSLFTILSIFRIVGVSVYV